VISKVFEKVTLQHILKTATLSRWEIGGLQQHGFKNNKSTITACKEIQSRIAHYLDQGEYLAMASLDLLAAFDVVNVDLLLKRLKILGFTEDLQLILKSWLTGRAAYVEVEGTCSQYFEIEDGTIQGSCLGPVLFNVFIEPLLDTLDSIYYADDGYHMSRGTTKMMALKDLEAKVIRAEHWMSGSGLKVNMEKTELIVFHRHDTSEGTINFNGTLIKSKNEIKVLGVLFDTRLNWERQVENAITGAGRALQGVKLIRRFFTEEERKTLITSCVFSKLYYGAELWLTCALKERLWKRLYSFSGSALKVINMRKKYKELHKYYSRATPKMFSLYVLSLCYYDLINNNVPELDYNNALLITMNDRRNLKAIFTTNARFKIGRNSLSKRLIGISNKINKSWLSLPKSIFKTFCKNLFIKESLDVW